MMIPVSHRDLFAPVALQNPFPLYRELRDLGPVVHLPALDVYALPRFDDVQQALRRADVLVSGRGVGFNPTSNGRPPAIINSDGEYHRRVRSQMARPLMPAALKPNRPALLEAVRTRILALRGTGWIDGIAELAQYLPLSAISHMVGLPPEGRQNMLRWASAAFNAIGPGAEHVSDDVAALAEARRYIQEVDRGRLRPDSWAAALFRSIDEGRLTELEARGALSGYVLPSLDTTIYAQGNLLHNLGTREDQWQLLRERPDLISNAVVESVRHSAVVRWFSRVAVKDYVVEDSTIPAGGRVMILYGSANRDERRFADPDRFDVTRRAHDQLGWGTGPHICAGMHLAKLEMEVLLEALVDTVERIEVGEPTLGTSQGLFGFGKLPLRLD